MAPKEKRTKKKGDPQPRHRRILLDPNSRAFNGWDKVESPWTFPRCKLFVGWCHIGKLFPLHRHKIHLHNNCANLHYCRDDDFVQRCIEVHRALYGTPKVPKSEVSLGICQMVYAELKLGIVVDWSTMKTSKKVTVPNVRDIPRAGPSHNPRDGLGPKKNIIAGVPDSEYSWSTTSSTSD